MANTSTPNLQAYAEPLVAISTGHLDADTGTSLDDNAWGLIIYPTDTGAFVYCNPATPFSQDVPSELLNILTLAKAAGFVWVKFDRDACLVDGLPAFDW